MYARTELGPLQESLKIALSLSDSQIALLQGPALAFSFLIFAVPLGLVVDRYSRKNILILATLVDLVATVIGGMTQQFGVLFASRCAIGACSPLTIIAACSLISDSYGVNERGRATTVVVLGAVAGTAAGFMLGGELLSVAPGGARAWHYVMLSTAGVLLPAIPVSLCLRETSRQERAQKTPSVRSMLGELRRYRLVIAVLIAGMAMVNLAVVLLRQASVLEAPQRGHRHVVDDTTLHVSRLEDLDHAFGEPHWRVSSQRCFQEPTGCLHEREGWAFLV
jgi:predicted MFS family arabinose efflux permease